MKTIWMAILSSVVVAFISGCAGRSVDTSVVVTPTTVKLYDVNTTEADGMPGIVVKKKAIDDARLAYKAFMYDMYDNAPGVPSLYVNYKRYTNSVGGNFCAPYEYVKPNDHSDVCIVGVSLSNGEINAKVEEFTTFVPQGTHSMRTFAIPETEHTTEFIKTMQVEIPKYRDAVVRLRANFNEQKAVYEKYAASFECKVKDGNFLPQKVLSQIENACGPKVETVQPIYGDLRDYMKGRESANDLMRFVFSDKKVFEYSGYRVTRTDAFSYKYYTGGYHLNTFKKDVEDPSRVFNKDGVFYAFIPSSFTAEDGNVYIKWEKDNFVIGNKSSKFIKVTAIAEQYGAKVTTINPGFVLAPRSIKTVSTKGLLNISGDKKYVRVTSKKQKQPISLSMQYELDGKTVSVFNEGEVGLRK